MGRKTAGRRKQLLAAGLLCLLFSIVPAGAEQYRLAVLTLNSLGKTKVQAVRNALPAIDETRIFESKEAFEAYLDSIVQALENTRQLDNISYTYTVSGTDSSGVLLADGDIEGSPYYMSPEQARGEELGWSSDQYSLGLSFFTLELALACI